MIPISRSNLGRIASLTSTSQAELGCIISRSIKVRCHEFSRIASTFSRKWRTNVLSCSAGVPCSNTDSGRNVLPHRCASITASTYNRSLSPK